MKFINHNGNILDLRTPPKPPEIVTCKTRVTRKVREKPIAVPKAEVEKPKASTSASRAPKVKDDLAFKQLSPGVVVNPPDPDIVGEVYWAAAPASKYLRGEGTSSHQSSSKPQRQVY